jgi:DNA-binding MarR family transcriptional regulator
MYDYYCDTFTRNRQRERKPMDALNMAGHWIRRLHQHSTAVFIEATQAQGYDLTPVQFAALDAINSHPGSDQAAVAAMIGYDRATIGGVIDRLDKKGWVTRVVSDRDRRARELSLSAEGGKVYAAIKPIVTALQQDILAPLSDPERAQLIQLARRAVEAGRN